MNTHPRYPHLVVEVGGDFACFTRPELKSVRFSYEVMTPSAARSILESIFWKPQFEYIIVKIDVLKPIRGFSIRRNEVKKVISKDWVRRAMADTGLRYDVEDDRDQRNSVVLRDVSYRIHAQVRLRPGVSDSEAKYREQFRRRVDRGACHNQPFLGAREFSARFGKATAAVPITDTTDKDKRLGVMLHSIDYHADGNETYRWFDARLHEGVSCMSRHTESSCPPLAPRPRAGELMPVKALIESHSDTTIPRYHRMRAVRWVIRIDADGNQSLIDRADADHKAGSALATPYLTRARGIAPMLVVDTLEYVLEFERIAGGELARAGYPTGDRR